MLFRVALGCVLLCFTNSECFYEKVLGAHLHPKHQVFEKLDINTRLQDVLDQWCDIREEDLQCSLVNGIDLCQYHSVEQALLLDGPVRLEDLSIFKNVPSGLYDSASVITSSLIFPGGTHCYIDSKTGAKVLEKKSCDVFFQAVATDLGFDVNFEMNPKMYQYVIASGTSITATVRSNEKAKILGVTSIYTKTVHLRTEQLFQELKQIMNLLLTIEKTTGLNVLTTSLLIPLASCLNTNESALLGILENAEVGSIRNCLVTLTGRPKKSSLFQYLFSNGAEVEAFFFKTWKWKNCILKNFCWQILGPLIMTHLPLYIPILP